MAEESDQAGKDVLEKFLTSEASTSNDTQSDPAAKQAAKSLLDIYDNDVQAVGAELLEFIQEQTADGNIEQLSNVMSAVKAQVSREDFQQFGWAIRDAWNYFDPEDGNPDQALERERWRRLNAFVALLAAQGDEDVLLNGLWTLRSALEDEEGVDGNLPAAAMWMIIAGQEIFESTETFKSDNPKGGDPARPGKKFDGPSGFSEKRWLFWRKGFENAQSNDSLNQKTKQWAKRAVKAMDEMDDSD